MAAGGCLLFSDVDGTLVHYRPEVLRHGTLSASAADGLDDTFTPAVRGQRRRCAWLQRPAGCSRSRRHLRPRRTAGRRSRCCRCRRAAPAW
jgi:hypothetical protein